MLEKTLFYKAFFEIVEFQKIFSFLSISLVEFLFGSRL